MIPLHVVASTIHLVSRATLPALRSDCKNVLFINWLVSAARAKAVVPASVAIETLDCDGAYATLSVVVYEHGHFGPASVGPLRKIFPSPLQSDWRVFAEMTLEESVALDGTLRAIVPVRTVLSSTLHTVAAKVFSPLPAAHAARFTHALEADVVRTRIDARGDPLVPDLNFEARLGGRCGTLPAEWRRCFSSWKDAVEYFTQSAQIVTANPSYTKSGVKKSRISTFSGPDPLPLFPRVLRSEWLSTNFGETPPCLAFFYPECRYDFVEMPPDDNAEISSSFVWDAPPAVEEGLRTSGVITRCQDSTND